MAADPASAVYVMLEDLKRILAWLFGRHYDPDRTEIAAVEIPGRE